MKEAILYARLACANQNSPNELDAQVKILRAYAEAQGLTVVKTIAHVGMPQRQQLGLLIDYIRQQQARIVIIRSIDRLCSSMNDWLELANLIEELHIEIHFANDGWGTQKSPIPTDEFLNNLKVLITRNYISNLAKEIVRGQLAKAEHGQYPGHAPYGYSHDPENRTIVLHPTRSDAVELIFSAYAAGMRRAT